MNGTRDFTIWHKGKKYEIRNAVKEGKEWKGLCPFHDDHDPSLRINAEKGVWFCPVCWIGGGLFNPDFRDTDKNIKIIYGYPNEKGEILIRKFKFITYKSGKKKKSFAFQRKGENGNWVWGLKGLKPPLFNLPQVLKNDVITIPEGEDDCLNIKEKWNLPATTNPYGAGPGKWENFREIYNPLLKGKNIIIPFDNDKEGKAFAQEKANSLSKVAKGIKVIELPGLGDKEDISDWIRQGHTKEEFFKLIKDTPLFESTEDKLDFSKAKFSAKPYAEMIFKDFHFKADELDRFYIYDKINGIWREKADVYLRHYLRKKYLVEKDLKKFCVSEIVAHIKDLSFLDIEEIEELRPPLNLIPFANCIYDLDTNKTIEYSPKYFFTTKLKVKYNPDCGGCPTIDKIFHELVREEDVITLYEIAGYPLWRDYPYPKIFFLYGSGGNGKTTFSNILVRLFGMRNMSTENSYSLQTDKFASSVLFEKYVNISTEMEYTLLRNTSLLKRLTGEDLIKCERKFKEPFQFYNYAKMIFMGNAIPETLDTTGGWYRRVFLLEFPNKFVEGKNADPDIIRNLPESEIEGLALWAIIKFKELRKRKFVFTRHEEILKVKKRYEELSNPLAKFLEDYCEKDYRTEIFCEEFYERFIEFLQEKEMRTIEPNAVGRRMTQLGYKSKLVTREDKRASAYLGLKWR